MPVEDTLFFLIKLMQHLASEVVFISS